MQKESLLNLMGLQGEIEKVPPKTPYGKEVMGFSVSATVENKPQLLRPVRPLRKTISPPSELSTNAKTVLSLLLQVFNEKGFMKEGLVKDVIFGFVDVYGMNPTQFAYGLVDLKRSGYVSFKGKDNAPVSEESSNLAECWLCYEPKLYDLLGD